MLSANNWIDKHYNTFNNLDGAYGAQCWDLFAKFCKDAGYPIFYCRKTGYVKDLWTERKTSGILKYFDEVTINNTTKGDWIIWTLSPYGTGNSHIAMFISHEANNRVKVLGQNQTRDQKASYAVLTKRGIGGCLRPKCYVKDYLNPIKNDKVKELQKALNADLNKRFTIDGWCGEKTQKAMKSFKVQPYPHVSYNKYPNVTKFVQKQLGGLVIDGCLGQATQKALIKYQNKKKLASSGNIYFEVLWHLVQN